MSCMSCSRVLLCWILTLVAAGTPMLVEAKADTGTTPPRQAPFLLAPGPATDGQAKAGTTAPRRPNIIYLMTDDQRMDTLGCYGNRIIQTPNIDSLAAQGVRFTNAFVTTAICMTNRACVFTGQYLSRHRINDFRSELSVDALAHTYPALLKKAGYRIGFIGKWGVGNPPRDLFDFDRAFPGQNVYYGRKGKHGNQHLTSLMGDQAMEFLEGCSKDQPFQLSISFKAPHVQDSANVRAELWPYDRALAPLYRDQTIPLPKLAAPAYFERLPDFLKNSENRARWAVRFWGPERCQQSLKGYYRLVTGVDRVVGRIVDKLAVLGLAANTVIIYTSDHGYYFGEYGFAGKWYPHDVSIRVPLILYDPRQPRLLRGTVVKWMALSIDMAPTILAYAGIAIPERMQGRSVKAIANGHAPDKWRTEFFYEHMFRHRAIPRTQGVRTTRWKYIRYIDRVPVYEQLYDLVQDPIEAHNLADDTRFDGQLHKMRAKWTQWRKWAR